MRTEDVRVLLNILSRKLARFNHAGKQQIHITQRILLCKVHDSDLVNVHAAANNRLR